MLAKATEELVKDISANFGENAQRIAEEDPEAYLLSMLTKIRERIPVPSATLIITIETAHDVRRIQKAKEKIHQGAA